MDRVHTVITVPSECGNTTITLRLREPIPRSNAVRINIDGNLPPADLDEHFRVAFEELRRDKPDVWKW